VPRVQQGSIIRALVTDTRGQNPKPRPLVVVSKTAEIHQSGIFFAVAITGEFSEPPLLNEIPLPWDARGNCRTGLTKACVANCGWMREIPLTDVIEIKGHLGGEKLDEVVTKSGMQ
jgi:hypothetical protein